MIEKFGRKFQFGSIEILHEFAKDQNEGPFSKNELKNWLSEIYDSGKHPIVVKGSKYYFTTKKSASPRVKKVNVDYYEYLKSPEWRSLKNQVIKERGSACQLCGITKQLHLHHMTYKRLGREDKRDLLLVCKSCHAFIHGKH
jgi:hypothetical protein